MHQCTYLFVFVRALHLDVAHYKIRMFAKISSMVRSTIQSAGYCIVRFDFQTQVKKPGVLTELFT